MYTLELMAEIRGNRFKLLFTRLCDVCGDSSHYAQYLLIIILCVLAYSNTLFSPFVLDDFPTISGDPMVTKFSLKGLQDGFSTRRGVGVLSFQLNYLLAKDNVLIYHLTNLLIHLANSILVMKLLQLMMGIIGRESKEEGNSESSLLPFFVALLFAVHPLQTQGVTYIVQRFASLATFFYLAALLAYLLVRAEQTRAGKLFDRQVLFFGGVSVASAYLAFNTKEIAYTLPLAALMLELFLFGTGRKKLAMLATAGGAVLAIIGYKVVTQGASFFYYIDAATRVQSVSSRSDYLCTQFRVIVTYLRLIFFPVNQRVEYDYPLLKSFFDWRVFCSFVVIATLISAGGYLLKISCAGKSPYARLAAIGIFWFFLTLSIESSVIPIIDLVFEHRVYLPMFGALTAIVALIAMVAEKYGRGLDRLCRPVLIVSLCLAVVTFNRNRVWTNEVSLWSDNVQKSPQSGRAWNSLGAAYIRERDGNAALKALIRSIELDPSTAHAWNNVGLALDLLGAYNDRFHRVYEMFHTGSDEKKRQALFAEVNNNLGLAYEITGNLSKAGERYRAAISYAPTLTLAYYNIGILSSRLGDVESYSRQLNMLRILDPPLAERLQLRVEGR